MVRAQGRHTDCSATNTVYCYPYIHTYVHTYTHMHIHIHTHAGWNPAGSSWTPAGTSWNPTACTHNVHDVCSHTVHLKHACTLSMHAACMLAYQAHHACMHINYPCRSCGYLLRVLLYWQFVYVCAAFPTVSYFWMSLPVAQESTDGLEEF